MTGNFSATDPIKRHCSYCKDSGWIAIRSRDGSYAFAGAVPDGAKGFVDADCWFCDSGPPLCDTCLGTGEIDERLGGEPSSNIVACPDCTPREGPTQFEALDLGIGGRGVVE